MLPTTSPSASDTLTSADHSLPASVDARGKSASVSVGFAQGVAGGMGGTPAGENVMCSHCVTRATSTVSNDEPFQRTCHRIPGNSCDIRKSPTLSANASDEAPQIVLPPKSTPK